MTRALVDSIEQWMKEALQGGRLGREGPMRTCGRRTRLSRCIRPHPPRKPRLQQYNDMQRQQRGMRRLTDGGRVDRAACTTAWVPSSPKSRVPAPGRRGKRGTREKQVPTAPMMHLLPADVAPPPIRLAHQARSLPRSLPFLRLSKSLRLLFLPSRTPQLPQI